jgi:cytochrome c5
MRFAILFSIALVIGAAGAVFAGSTSNVAAPVTRNSAASQEDVNQKWMIEGAKRYRENCGRCHQAPRNFSPRIMATAVQHMRVRAMLTDEDTKYLLYYLSH